MRLIGLNGRRGAGKDTAFQSIKAWAEGRGLTAVRRGFADMLKLSAYRVFFPECDLERAIMWADADKNDPHKRVGLIRDPHGETMSISIRQFLQRYGTEAHRGVFGDDFWVDALLRDELTMLRNFAMEDKSLPTFGVVTDVRFLNEARRIKRLGGEVWEIRRPTEEKRDAHASEAELSSELIDQVILNDRDLDSFNTLIGDTMTNTYRDLRRIGAK